MEIIVGLIGVIAVIASPVSMIMMLFKKHRKRGFQVFMGSLVGIIIAAYGIGQMPDYNAQQEGYLDAADKRLAKDAGYVSAEEWSKDRSKVLAKQRQERQALNEAAKKRAAEETRLKEEQAKHQADAAAKVKAQQAAAEQAHKDAETAKRAAKTQRMTDSIVATIRRHYKYEAQPSLPNKPFCREDGYCTLVVGDFRMQVWGKGIVDIETTTQSPHSRYREMCSAVFSAISGSNLDFAAEVIEGAFANAGQNGSFKHNISGTEIAIRRDGIGVLACSFFKYGS